MPRKSIDCLYSNVVSNTLHFLTVEMARPPGLKATSFLLCRRDQVWVVDEQHGKLESFEEVWIVDELG